MNMKLRVPPTILAILASTAISQADVPKLINYQGRLTDASGQALPDGTYSVRFEIFAAKEASLPGGTNVIWGATYTNVSLDSGQFNVVLGAAGGQPVAGAVETELGFAFEDSSRYLQMTVVNGPAVSSPFALAPRQRFLSVPYAFNGVPPGTILSYGGSQAPPGFLLCNGQAIDRNEYRGLFRAIGTAFGAPDNSSFNVPDLRGRFLRGVDSEGGRDLEAESRSVSMPGGNEGALVGSLQNDGLADHWHHLSVSGTTDSAGAHTHLLERSNGTQIRWGDGAGYSTHAIDAGDGTSEGSAGAPRARSNGVHAHPFAGTGITTSTAGGTVETRPKNVYVHYIIKY